MDQRASSVQKEAVQLLLTALSIWAFGVLIAVLGYLFSREITSNIQKLESVLKRVAKDTHDNEAESLSQSINLDTASGTMQAYSLLERIIESYNFV